MKVFPRISVIIATFNANSALQKTILQLKKIKYQNLEIIVIDANSNDGTLEFLQSQDDFINQWVSEPDEGIYDAWNKGIIRATGEWIAFLGAGDFFVEDGLQMYARFIDSRSEKPDFISSRINLIDENCKILRTVGVAWEWNTFKKTMRIAHVGSLHNKTLFEKYGLFDKTWRIVGDYELLYRPKEQLKAEFLNNTTASMSAGGVSTNIKALKEAKLMKRKFGERSQFFCEIDFITAVIKLSLRKFLRMS